MLSPHAPPRFARSCGVHDMSPRLHVAGVHDTLTAFAINVPLIDTSFLRIRH